MASKPPERDPEELSDQAWDHHRKRQLESLGIDVEDLDGDDR